MRRRESGSAAPRACVGLCWAVLGSFSLYTLVAPPLHCLPFHFPGPQVRLPDGAPYETSRDHAKWGVHAERPLVVSGDLNRTQS